MANWVIRFCYVEKRIAPFRRDPIRESFTKPKTSACRAFFYAAIRLKARIAPFSRDPIWVGFTKPKTSTRTALFLRSHPSESKDCDFVAILLGRALPNPKRALAALFFYAAIRLKASFRRMAA